ncbi:MULTISPECIES: LysR family transcriptional regulator [Pacificibacter]|uniref:LysR family transcriptional regulator n=1 Tax=Pacificibacter TaxID=1042323 RepID=UPI001C095E5D|nr:MULTISPECIES: LysR family transcriptional regulator [Pacificibacter]MBU2937040.1 LysR family transcriptional regulator [Pacificibacter marinus]MDO6616420.1 LysR family transcriptional regulator [Pacificibacter sp. 1_MG-2023]
MHMPLRQIEAFRAVIETGSMTEAGKLLNVSQPAISRQIRELEQRFGINLFLRRAGRVEPTKDAQLLFAEVERCLGGLEQFVKFAGELGVSRRQRLRIAATVGHSYFLLPEVIHAFHEIYPDVTISLRSGPSPEVVDLIEKGQSDIGFALLPPESHGVITETMPEVELVCVVPKNHPLETKDFIEPIDLKDTPLLLISEDSLMRKRLLQAFQEASIRPNVIVDSTYTGPICSLVGQNMGVSIIDHLTAASNAYQDITIKRFRPSIPCELKLVTHARQDISAPAQAFVDLAKEVLVRICETSDLNAPHKTSLVR